MNHIIRQLPIIIRRQVHQIHLERFRHPDRDLLGLFLSHGSTNKKAHGTLRLDVGKAGIAAGEEGKGGQSATCATGFPQLDAKEWTGQKHLSGILEGLGGWPINIKYFWPHSNFKRRNAARNPVMDALILVTEQVCEWADAAEFLDHRPGWKKYFLTHGVKSKPFHGVNQRPV